MPPVNGGFWDLPADVRQAAYDDACARFGVQDFFDLDAGDRGDVYDRAAAGFYGTAVTP